MTKSEEWEQFSAYRPMIEDALRRGREQGWEAAKRELRGIPHWWNSEDSYGEFDLQPLGPDETSEQGAYMAVKEIMDNNPYRGENK